MWHTIKPGTPEHGTTEHGTRNTRNSGGTTEHYQDHQNTPEQWRSD